MEDFSPEKVSQVKEACATSETLPPWGLATCGAAGAAG
eukprot:CAMPEP_0176318634 /NCGR_PEP_ID=MMETSP0121_2-20121125/69879_1 /TAXON_ID=160619 /ORGANISM="Kryptoperidinium foliaceum, Strain CCMP 1326" /LENGTH=37 /DNA_ID= /DNA_START= /DNA_END= /DNA_ORIENTATION=